MKKVGILGGGQLGMLLSQSIARLGGEAIIYEPNPTAPALRTVNQSFNANWDDKNALTKFFQKCDVVTYEFENVPSTAIAHVANLRPIFPSLSVLSTTQNRAVEKKFLKDSKLPHVNFAVVNHPEELIKAASELTFPLISKSALGGYDGKFQEFIPDSTHLANLASSLTPNLLPIVLEKAVDLHLELSCITARSSHGEEIVFPVLQNVHRDHILDTTLIPAQISPQLEKAIHDLALAAARKLDVVGLLCTEFFITKNTKKAFTGYVCEDFTIYINEFAPRPHNSGHVTMAACSLSQFDALARLLLNIPLTQPRLLAPGYFCMGNLLGELWHGHKELSLASLTNYPEIIELTLYGKNEARPKRKMGHFITYSTNPQQALSAAIAFKHQLGKIAIR